MKKITLLAALLLWLGIQASAQITLVRSKSYDQAIQSVSTHIYRIAVGLRGGEVLLWHVPISDFNRKAEVAAFNPSGAYIAVGSQNGKIIIFRSEARDDILKTFNGHNSSITDLAFNPTGNILISGDKDGLINIWDMEARKKAGEMRFHQSAITSLAISKAGVIISGDEGGKVHFWRQDEFIKTYNNEQSYAVDISLSEDGKWLAISYRDGMIQLWDQKTLEMIGSFYGTANRFNPVSFLPNAMYLAYARSDSLQIFNCKKFANQAGVKANNGTITTLCNIVDRDKNEVFIITGGDDKMIYIWDVNQLEKRYDVIIKNYVDAEIQNWQKMLNNENAEDFNIRVTDENRLKKIQELTQLKTNELASEKYPLLLTDISKYDYDNQTYAIQLDAKFNSIINVPYEQSDKFKASYNKLETRNPRFVLNESNDFDLAYAEIMNPTTGNFYVFDRNEEYQFDPTAIDMQFAPIRIANKVAQTEDILKEKLETITKRSYLEEKITDNVQTNVTAKAIVEETDEGEKELNFHVEYSYEVIKATIAAQTDDFPLGEYKFTSSNAARLTLQVFKESLEKELSEYFNGGKKVTVKITGSTDASPVTGVIPYTGDYGIFTDEAYFLNGNLESVSITPQTGITSNKQLAYLRTVGVRRFIEDYIDIMKGTNNYYQHFAELSSEKGGEYRRISIELIIHNAFQGMEAPPERLISENCQSDVDTNIPENDTVRKTTYALVIGNEDYSGFQEGLDHEANVHFAIHDAERVAEYFHKTMGIPEPHIKLLTNATASQIKRGLSWLTNLAKIKEGSAQLFLYYSGHGLPDEVSKEAYIIPVDVSGSDLTYALSLDEIFQDLSQYTTERVTVLLDACFSGGARDKALIEKKMVKVVPKKEMLNDNFIVLSSSQGNESSGYLKEQCHGLFTYYFIKKLQETMGNVSYQDLFNSIEENVLNESALKGDMQTPSIRTGWDINKNWKEWEF